MPDQHTTLHASLYRSLGNVIASDTLRIIGAVRVKIQWNPELLGCVEEPVDVRALFTIHVRAPAEHIEPSTQALAQQIAALVVMKYTFLRKGNELQFNNP